MATAQSRSTLAGNVAALYREFGLDGVDIDWEYPGQAGNAGNGVDPQDTARFLLFLQVLRRALPAGAVLTAAAQTVPFADAQGNPGADVRAFAQVLDWVLIMNYDTWGGEFCASPVARALSLTASLRLRLRSLSPPVLPLPVFVGVAASDPPGPNAPLSDQCGNSTQPAASALAALRAWTGAGFPAAQLVLGVPSYGYVSRSSASRLRVRARASADVGPPYENRRRRAPVRQYLEWTDALALAQEARPQWRAAAGAGPMLIVNEDGNTNGGSVQFRELVRQGALSPYTPQARTTKGTVGLPAVVNATAIRTSEDASPDGSSFTTADAAAMPPPRQFAGGGGFSRRWDGCSGTPFLRSGGARQVVSYDDPASLAAKAQLAREAGMRGVNLFDVHGDTDEWDLADALRRGLALAR